MQTNIVKRQQGVAILGVSVILLFVCLLASLFTIRSMASHQKILSNNYWNNQAFEAAEGGMEYAIAYLNDNPSIMLQDTNSDGFINPAQDPLTSAIMSTPITTGSFSTQVINLVANDLDILQITSTGTSQDGSVSKTISQLVHFMPLVTSFPSAPLTALRNIDISGNVTIANTTGNTTIVSGGTVALSGSASTEADGGVSSDKNGLNTDVTENAFSPAMTQEAFFAQYFAASPEVIKNSAQYFYSNNSNTNYSSDLNGKVGTSIWVEQTGGTAIINGPTTIGSPDKPVIMIVDGNFSLNGNMTLYGMLYVTGDWFNDGGGTATVEGAIVVAGDFQSLGTPDINYTPGADDDIKALGPYLPVPGTWKDF